MNGGWWINLSAWALFAFLIIFVVAVSVLFMLLLLERLKESKIDIEEENRQRSERLEGED